MMCLMRIEDDDARRESRTDTIRQIQDYQQRVESETSRNANTDAARADARAREQSGADDPVHTEEQRKEIQAQQLRTQELTQSQTGAEKHDDAVKAANAQQDRGQDWQAFAQDAPEAVIPPSVEDAKTEQQATDRREEEQRINVRELVNRMRLQSGKIDA